MSMQLVLGVAGVMAAPYLGITMAMGWTLGVLAATLLFPPAGPDGPRLSDLKPQSSEYGRAIPIVYGKMGLAGNVIWASDLIETEEEVGGSFFADGATVYHYFGNMAVAVCEGPVKFGRVWAGNERRLIYDPATGNLEGKPGGLEGLLGQAMADFFGVNFGPQIRFYEGNETQLPDPLIESYLGAGNVPAYRGTAYVVLERFPLAKDGNRLPQLFVEVGREPLLIAGTGPKWISSVWVVADFWVVSYYGGANGVVIRRLSDDSQVSNFYSTEYPSGAFDSWSMDATRFRLFMAAFGPKVLVLDLTNGELEQTPLSIPPGADTLFPGADMEANVYHWGFYILAAQGGNPGGLTLWFVDPDDMRVKRLYNNPSVLNIQGPLFAPSDAASPWIYALSSTKIYKLSLQPGLPILAQNDVVAGWPGYVPTMAKRDARTGFIWVVDYTSYSDSIGVTVYDDDLVMVYREVLEYEGYVINPSSILFFNDGADKVSINTERWLAIPFHVIFDANAPEAGPIRYADGNYHGTGSIHQMFQNPVTNEIYGLRFGANYDKTSGTYPTPENVPVTFQPFLDADLNLGSQSLSTILIDLSERAGIDSTDVVLTSLKDKPVMGYAVTSQTSVRDAIQALAPHFFFDAVESQGKVKYVTRANMAPIIIAEDDLGAHESGSDPADPLTVTRAMDQELPHTMTVRYMSEERKYELETKYARRLIRNDGNEATLDAPIVMTDRQAATSASVNLFGVWAGRRSFAFSLPIKYAYLEPTDLVSVKGHVMRIVSIKQSGGRFQIEAKAEDLNVYTPTVQTAPVPVDPEGVRLTALTHMEVM